MPDQSPDAFDPSCPLRGAILCCTSIPPEKRTELAERAEEMGAKHVYDLTSDVTHLIVGEYNTPKYRYVAKERPDVLVVDSRWVDAVRNLWISDQKIDLEALEKIHTLPAFATLKISVTGFDDHAERQRISELIQEHGAEYHGNLTKHVTHLLAFRTEGLKYKHATQWGLPIVSIEWLHASIERGMILDEKLYHPDIPIGERGQNAWIRRKLPVARTRKRTRAEDLVDEGRRKLRRTASAKLSDASEQIWGDIMVSGASAVIDQVQVGEWEESNVQEKSKKDTKKSTSIFTNHPGPEKSRALFTGLQFYLHGFNDKKQKLLEEFLLSRDAQFAPTLDALEEMLGNFEKSYILVPNDLQASDRPAIPESLSSIPMITEIWVERCYDLKSIQDPAAHILGRPFPIFPLPTFSGLIISSTSFTGFELLHVSKVVELLGAKYDEYLTPTHSVLICASSASMTRAKFNHAQKWKIPVVSAEWLWDSIETGERKPFQNYLYRVKKTIKELESATSESGLDKAIEGEPCSSSRDAKTQSLSGHSSKNADTIRLEDDADTTVEIKGEEDQSTRSGGEKRVSKSPQIEQSNQAPLTEISRNLTKADSSTPKVTPPSPSAPLAIPVPREDIDNAISSLLAKSKASSNIQIASADVTAADRKRCHPTRGRTRILGRATSNVSITSATSIDSSVDSTATYGNAVHWPACKVSDAYQNLSITAQEHGAEGGEGQSLSQPPQTQRLEWEEDESAEYKYRVLKKITGKSDERKGVKEKAITLGDLNDLPRINRSGLKSRGGKKR